SISGDPKRRYLGVDFAPAAIAAARRRFAPQADRIRFQCADALAIPTADTGVCVFLGLLDWLSDEEASALFSARREPRLLFSFTEPDGFLASLYRQYRRRADTTAYRARAFAEPDILCLLARGGYRAEKILRDPRLGPSCLVVAVKL
ncbi:MAG: methyltransferase domain-containing protein, partial [Elusimicrobiota bacterium]